MKAHGHSSTIKYTDAQDKGAKTTDAQDKGVKTTDAQDKGAKATNAQDKGAKATDAQDKDAKTTDAQDKDAKTTDAQDKDAKTTDAQDKGAKATDAQYKGAKATDAQDKDAKTTDAQATDAQDKGAKATDTQDIGAKATYAQDIGAQATDTQDKGAKATDAQDIGTKATDAQDIGAKATYAQGNHVKATDEQGTKEGGLDKSDSEVDIITKTYDSQLKTHDCNKKMPNTLVESVKLKNSQCADNEQHICCRELLQVKFKIMCRKDMLFPSSSKELSVNYLKWEYITSEKQADSLFERNISCRIKPKKKILLVSGELDINHGECLQWISKKSDEIKRLVDNVIVKCYDTEMQSEKILQKIQVKYSGKCVGSLSPDKRHIHVTCSDEEVLKTVSELIHKPLFRHGSENCEQFMDYEFPYGNISVLDKMGFKEFCERRFQKAHLTLKFDLERKTIILKSVIDVQQAVKDETNRFLNGLHTQEFETIFAELVDNCPSVLDRINAKLKGMTDPCFVQACDRKLLIYAKSEESLKVAREHINDIIKKSTFEIDSSKENQNFCDQLNSFCKEKDKQFSFDFEKHPDREDTLHVVALCDIADSVFAKIKLLMACQHEHSFSSTALMSQQENTLNTTRRSSGEPLPFEKDNCWEVVQLDEDHVKSNNTPESYCPDQTKRKHGQIDHVTVSSSSSANGGLELKETHFSQIESVPNVTSDLMPLANKYPNHFLYNETNQMLYVAVHQKIVPEVSVIIERLQNLKPLSFDLPLYAVNYIKHNLEKVRGMIKRYLKFPEHVDIHADQLIVLSDKDRSVIQRGVCNVLGNLQFTEVEVEPSKAQYLQSVPGHQYVRFLNMKYNNCHISVSVPEQQLLATSPTKQQLLMCESKMAVLLCQVLVLPSYNSKRNNRPVSLLEDFLHTNMEGCSAMLGPTPKPLLLPLTYSNTTQGQMVVVMPAVEQNGSVKENIRAALEVVLKKLPRTATIALPVKMSENIPLEKCLKIMLPILKLHMEQKENCNTIILYFDEESDVNMKRLIEYNLFNTSISSSWIRAPSNNQCNRMKVVFGELHKIQADVLVNSTDANLELQEGQVSKSILIQAGEALAEQCKYLYPKGIGNNLLAVTESFKLKNAKEIFHIVPVQGWTAEEGENILDHLQRRIRACLLVASAKQYKSIAFPALGTGNLGYPADKVAQTMMLTISNFFKEMPQSSLQDVFIVCFPKSKAIAKTFKVEETIQTFWQLSGDLSKKVCTEARLELKNTLVHFIVGNDREQQGVAEVITVVDPPAEGSLEDYKTCVPSTSKVYSVDRRKVPEEMKKAFNNAKSVQINTSSFGFRYHKDIMASVMEACNKQQDCLLNIIIVVSDIKELYDLISAYHEYLEKNQSWFSSFRGQEKQPKPVVIQTELMKDGSLFKKSTVEIWGLFRDVDKTTAMTFKVEETFQTFWHLNDDLSQKVCTEAFLELKNTLVHFIVGNAREQQGVAEVIIVGDPPVEGSLEEYKNCAPSTSKVCSVDSKKLHEEMKKALVDARSVQINISSFGTNFHQDIVFCVMEACIMQHNSLLNITIVVPEVKDFNHLISVYHEFLNKQPAEILPVLLGKGKVLKPFIRRIVLIKDGSQVKKSTVEICGFGKDVDEAAAMIKGIEAVLHKRSKILEEDGSSVDPLPSSTLSASYKETAEIKQENKEYDFMSQGVCKLVIPADISKEIMGTMNVSGLCGQMKFESKGTELSISRDEAAKLLKHLSESRKQSEVLQNKTDLIRELDVLEYEALKYLFGQDFTGLFQEMSKENSDTLKISISLHNNEADRNLRDKLGSLRQEDLVLNPDEFEKIGFAIDAKSEGIAAFIKLLPDQGKLRIYSCDYNAMSKVKHLVSVKLGKVKITARANRKFDGGNTRSGGSYTNSPFQRSDPHCLASVHKDFLTKSSIKVLVYKADITQLTLDVIVNAANENLCHGGGVAAAIARAAGPSFELEGDEYMTKNGQIPVTEVVMTCAGNLPCKKVFHAVGPRWDDYTDKVKCQQDLMQTVFNCLVKAHSEHFESIAVSSISSAIFRVPQALCAQMYLAAIQKFEQQHGNNTTLKYIHFVDINDEMVGIIQDTFSRNWDVTVDVIIDNEATNKKYTEQMKDQPLISLPSQIPSSKTESVSLPETKSVLLTLGPCREFITPTNMRVLVYAEDITKLSVDAIVNAANEQLKHDGGVSAAIAKAAGQKLIDDGKSLMKKRGKLSATDVVVTPAGKLPCKYVLHAVGPRWNDYTDKELCKNRLFITIFNCLEEAHRLLLGSLAVSSVSSAVQGVPKEVCAKMYLKAVERFEESHGGNTSLKCIHFVDINPDMVGVIQDTFKEWWGSCSGHSEVRCSKGGNDATASAQLSGSQQQRMHSSGMMPVANFEIVPVEQNRNKKLHQYQFHFLKLDLIIQQQDIDCVLTDSIILWQTTGKKFFDDEISMRINTTFGKQHRELSEVERILKKGEMGVIIAKNKQLLYPVITSRNDIKHSIRNALETALTKMDEQKKKTVMMPRFPYAEKKGGKCSKEMVGEFATGVYTAVRNYTQRQNRSVTEVHIFDPDEDNVTTMVNTIASKAGEDNSYIN